MFSFVSFYLFDEFLLLLESVLFISFHRLQYTHIHTHFIYFIHLLNPSVSILKLRGENDNHNKRINFPKNKKLYFRMKTEQKNLFFELKTKMFIKYEEENEKVK